LGANKREVVSACASREQRGLGCGRLEGVAVAMDEYNIRSWLRLARTQIDSGCKRATWPLVKKASCMP